MHLVPVSGQTPEPKPYQALGVELEKLRDLTSEVMDATSVGDDKAIESLAKLVNAVSTLAKTCLACEKTVTEKEVNALIASMGAAVFAHVKDQSILAAINRDWMALVRESTG